MRKVAKIGLSCLLALTVAAPVVAIPGAIEAAPKKATAKKSYTTAERAYIKYQSDTLYKLRTQTEEIMNLMDKADDYEDEAFLILITNKLDAWNKTLKQATKYRPQDVPGTLQKAQGFFSAAQKHNLVTYQLLNNVVQNAETISDEKLEKDMEKFVREYISFKAKAGSFNEEINRLNKIYK